MTPTAPPNESYPINLNDLLWEFDEAQGLGRYVVMAKLRHYVTVNDVQQTIDEIRKITDHKHLDVLIGVGMRGHLYYAVIGRKAFLMGVT